MNTARLMPYRLRHHSRVMSIQCRLCGQVMQARGYPMGDFEQRAADVSVDHPQVVEHYRAAHAVAVKANRGEASTEDLRQAMVHYRGLFQELIETREPARVERS